MIDKTLLPSPVRFPAGSIPFTADDSVLRNTLVYVRGGTPSILRVQLAGLDKNGRFLYSTLRQQTLELNQAMAPIQDHFYICINDPKGEAPHLTLRVKITHSLTEMPSEWKPRLVEAASMTTAEVPSHTTTFNFIAKLLGNHLEDTGNQVWKCPDWIKKSEAATLIAPHCASPVNRIANWVESGRVAEWEDESISNPRHRRLVYRPQVYELLTEMRLKPRRKTKGG